MFTVIFFVLCGVLIFDIVQKHFSPLMVVSGVGIGLLLGIVLSRMSQVRWHEEESKVIARMDGIGVVILVLYLLFAFTRSRLLGIWVQGDAPAAVTIGITTGTMLGRVIGTMRSIRMVLTIWGLR